MASLEEKISFWESELKKTKNQMERGILSEKIANAKAELKKSNVKVNDPKMSTIIDAPSIADRSEENNDRGFITNTGEVFVTI